MDYEECDEEAYDNYEESEKAALYADGFRRLYADLQNLPNLSDYAKTGYDIYDGEIEVFEID